MHTINNSFKYGMNLGVFGLWNEVVHHLTLQTCQINYYSNLRFGDFCRPCSLIQPSSGSPWYAPIQPAPDSPASTYRFPKTPCADRFCSTVTEVGSSTISLHWSWLCWYFTFNCKWLWFKRSWFCEAMFLVPRHGIQKKDAPEFSSCSCTPW